MTYKITEATPEAMKCLVGSYPTIYECLREITPQEMKCGIGTCPSTSEATQNGKLVYLIVGKVINPSQEGLEGLAGRIGEGEALIEVPRALIDNRGK